jgi:CRP-like cAMP-binding protein
MRDLGHSSLHGRSQEVTKNTEAMTNAAGLKNVILARLPQKQFARLHAALEPVNLKFGRVLYQPGKAIRHVYFPIDCLISLLTAVDKRRTLEVGMVGNEGMAGMPFILGMGVSGVRALVQGGGDALRMGAEPFRIEFNRNPALQEALYRYMYALMAQISQTAACNRFHEAGPRLARWLLMTRDRVMSDEFPLTHEFLAHMLGMRREGVTEAASALKRRKLIRYQRGQIQILDLKGLKAASCSCYQIVQTAFKRVQG